LNYNNKNIIAVLILLKSIIIMFIVKLNNDKNISKIKKKEYLGKIC